MRENIILTLHTSAQTLTPITSSSSQQNATQFRAKPNASLSVIDLEILDEKFEPILNNRAPRLAVLLLIRRTKHLVT